MPENARRFAALYDQFEDEHQVADWGADDLFTRMPRPRVVDDAPPPRFRPSLVTNEPPIAESAPVSRRTLALVEPPGHRRRAPGGKPPSRRPRERERPSHRTPEREPSRRARELERSTRRAPRTGEQPMRERVARLGLAVIEPAAPAPAPDRPVDESGDARGRPTKVITGHPGGTPRALPTVRSERRRSPAEWIGPRPERIVAWAFALGLLLILIAIATADAATL